MIEQFYKDLLPHGDEYKLLWTLNNKQSHWFQHLDELITHVEENKNNIFFGIGATTHQLPTNKRATADQVTSIRCLHIDIDIKHKGIHANSRLPSTIAEGTQIAHSILEPTYIINSGHGLHAYYLTNEHIQINKKNFDYWTMLIKAFQQEHGKKFPQYTLDSTYDLSRILRCPGSLNCKNPEDIIECKIVEYNENAYYEPEEIEDAIQFSLSRTQKVHNMQQPKNASIPATQIATRINKGRRLTPAECRQWVQDNGIELSESRRLESSVFNNLRSLDPEFYEEYCNNTERKSPSEYQFRIAHIAVKNNLSDQQVIDIMIQHRNRNGHALKLNRVDMYVNDLLKVRSRQNIRRIDDTDSPDVTDDDKEVVRELLFGKLGIQVHTLWRYHRDPESYFELELSNRPDKIIYLGTMTEGIMNQNKFAGSVIGAVGEIPRRLKNNIWYYEVVQKLNKLTRDGITQDTSTFEGQVKLWVKDYLVNKDIIADLPTYIQNNVKSNPFYHNNYVYFTFEALAQWIQTSQSQHFDAFHFTITMSKNGFKQESIPGKNGFPIMLWKTPENYLTRNSTQE